MRRLVGQEAFQVGEGADVRCALAQLADDDLADGVAVVGGVQSAGELGGVLAAIGECDQAVLGAVGVDAVDHRLAEDLADAFGGHAQRAHR